MMRRLLLLSGVAALAAAWLGPLPELARQSFAAHMTMHMIVVAVAAPLVALGVSGTATDPVRRMPGLFVPIPASVIEAIVVWSWHAPVLHSAARHATHILLVEQASFIAAGLLLWLAVLGGDRENHRARVGAGVGALLFTSMHMTLLGALFALANRPLFAHASTGPAALSPLADQQIGGTVMLLVGGVSYLAGGLWLTARLLHSSSAAATVRRELPS
jgi:putative membrane protein